ncbi:uncharacterized protein LOC108157951 [Drosophila miranda]|uniref:uncharacterized protein LOC108157951 n=1 Tax=Drosophila miranda TaxID=7229 RepID=UPI00143F7FD8|nr:uncharacterized protein LOC108157951 [Drosophila miranda]
MCCVLQNCLKHVLFVASLVIQMIIICFMLQDYKHIRHGTTSKLYRHFEQLKELKVFPLDRGDPDVFRMKHYFDIWTLHSMCGTLMTILKFKDLCYLQWWVLMTWIYIVAGLALHLLLHDFHDEFYGIHEMVRNYFALGKQIAFGYIHMYMFGIYLLIRLS